MKPNKVLAVYPTRGRGQASVDRLLDCMLKARVSSFLVTIDDDDDETAKLFHGWQSDKMEVQRCPPNGKIAAINYGVAERIADYQMVLVLSDDMKPMLPSYDLLLYNVLISAYNDTDGTVWANDGFRGKKSQYPLMTIPILGRKYFERFGYVYHPDYKSFFCDDEFMAIANKLNRFVYDDRVLIKHEHLVNMGKPNDALESQNLKYWDRDKTVWQERKKLI
jgi:hypothetical protein